MNGTVTYTNIYSECHGLGWETPKRAQVFSRIEDDFVRVEQRIDEHWHRPPVGIRSDQASHKWAPHWRKHCIWTTYQGEILIPRSSPQKFVMSDGSQQS